MSDPIEFRLRQIGKSLDQINMSLERINNTLMHLFRQQASQNTPRDEIPQMVEKQKEILSPYQQMSEAINETERRKQRPTDA